MSPQSGLILLIFPEQSSQQASLQLTAHPGHCISHHPELGVPLFRTLTQALWPLFPSSASLVVSTHSEPLLGLF